MLPSTLDMVPSPSTKRQTQFHLYFAQTKWNTIAWKMTFRKTNLIDNRPSWHLPSSSACQVWFSGGSDWYRQLVSALKADVGASLIYFSPREYCEPRNAWQTSPKGRLRGGWWRSCGMLFHDIAGLYISSSPRAVATGSHHEKPILPKIVKQKSFNTTNHWI